jgi:hypothetical protein
MRVFRGLATFTHPGSSASARATTHIVFAWTATYWVDRSGALLMSSPARLMPP